MDKKEAILRSAKELFSINGFKDTGVAEIAKNAGVAAGTFYLYYASKEKLFMEIYMEENLKLKKAIMAEVDPEGAPLDVIRELMQKNIAGMQANPILKEWFNKEVFNKIEESFVAENGLDSVDFFYSNFLEIIRKWQQEGRMRADIDPDMIMALFSVVVIIDLHKEEIGVHYFPKIQEYMAEFLINGLTGSAVEKGDMEKGGE
jgi:AcrR family transcriptional regulator